MAGNHIAFNIAAAPSLQKDRQRTTARWTADMAGVCVLSADLPYLHKTVLNIHLYAGMFSGPSGRKMRAVLLSWGGWRR